MRALQPTGHTLAVSRPSRMRRRIHQPIRLGICRPESQPFPIRFGDERGCGIGRRLVHDQHRLRTHSIIHHEHFIEHADRICFHTAAGFQSHHSVARPSRLSSPNVRRRPSHAGNALINNRVLRRHPLRVTQQGLQHLGVWMLFSPFIPSGL